MKSYNIKINLSEKCFVAESKDGLVATIPLKHIDTLIKVLELECSKYYKPFLNFILNMTKKCAYENRGGVHDYKLAKLYDMKARGIIIKNEWYDNFPQIINELSLIMGLHYAGVHLSQKDRDYVVKKVEYLLNKTKILSK